MPDKKLIIAGGGPELKNLRKNCPENVTVTGTPQLTLETGGSDAVVNYTSTAANVLTFNISL